VFIVTLATNQKNKIMPNLIYLEIPTSNYEISYKIIQEREYKIQGLDNYPDGTQIISKEDYLDIFPNYKG